MYLCVNICLFGVSSGGHLNPAVSLWPWSSWEAEDLEVSHLCHSADVGAFVGAAAVFGLYTVSLKNPAVSHSYIVCVMCVFNACV